MRRLGNTGWTAVGINMVPSDSIYQNLVKAVNTGNISESTLAGIAGHRLPVTVDVSKKLITFEQF